jgi:hypothetical protein
MDPCDAVACHSVPTSVLAREDRFLGAVKKRLDNRRADILAPNDGA